MKELREKAAVEDNVTRAIQLPEVDILEMRRKYEEIKGELRHVDRMTVEELDEMINEKISIVESESEEEEQADEVEPSSEEEEMEIEEEEQADEVEPSSEEEDFVLDDEEAKIKKRGFVSASMINTYISKKTRKSVKSEDIFRSLIEKKFSNRKKQKKGSKTNREKLKNHPYLMMAKKVAQQKSQLKDLNTRMKKIKKFKGHQGKRLKTKKKSKK